MSNAKELITLQSARVTFWRPWLVWLAWLVNFFTRRVIVVSNADGAYRMGLEKLNDKLGAAVVELTLRLLERGPTTGGVKDLRAVSKARGVPEAQLELAYKASCARKGKPTKCKALCAELRKGFRP